MDPDKYQRAWQAQATQTRVTIDTDLLLKQLQRNQREFRATIFWRDFREIAIAGLLLPVWIYLGVRLALPWTWYLTVPVLVWMAGFMLVYRMRHRQKPGQPDEPLVQCVERSLTEVDDQIWLLRNVFWWYLLPPGISIQAFLVQTIWLRFEVWFDAVGFAFVFAVFNAVYAFLYWVNQYAVRSQLEPRRQELLTLRASLRDETASE